MRSFKSYMSRRRITDLKGWCAKNGITTNEDFLSFCSSRELAPGEFSDMFSSESNVSKALGTKDDSADAKTKEATLEEGETLESVEESVSQTPKTWHTPAALRPLRKSTPEDLETSSRKKRTRKSRTAKSSVEE